MILLLVIIHSNSHLLKNYPWYFSTAAAPSSSFRPFVIFYCEPIVTESGSEVQTKSSICTWAWVFVALNWMEPKEPSCVWRAWAPSSSTGGRRRRRGWWPAAAGCRNTDCCCWCSLEGSFHPLQQSRTNQRGTLLGSAPPSWTGTACWTMSQCAATQKVVKSPTVLFNPTISLVYLSWIFLHWCKPPSTLVLVLVSGWVWPPEGSCWGCRQRWGRRCPAPHWSARWSSPRICEEREIKMPCYLQQVMFSM